MRRGLPVGRYLLTVPVAAVLFMGLAVVDQRATFLSALRPAAAAAASAVPGPAAAAVEQAIREFDAAVQQAYAGGQMEALARIASPALVDEIARELSDPTLAAASRGLALAEFAVLQVEPDRDGGWQAVTDETWRSRAEDGPVRRSRLRFRYRVGRDGTGWRVEEMTPVLPEAERAARR